jgi:hypothetical protein
MNFLCLLAAMLLLATIPAFGRRTSRFYRGLVAAVWLLLLMALWLLPANR